MASKPFYSIEEVCEKLGKTADDVKALVRAGELREFRDGGKVYFKSDDIKRLAGSGDSGELLSLEDSGEIELEPAQDSGDDDGLPSIGEAGGGTSIIGLEPLGDDSADEASSKKKEDTVITKSGIGVFDDDELEIDADPMAKTQITTGASDQISLEGAGSGSGLLDLTREADDTALGAEILDEIWSGEDEAPAEAEPVAPTPPPRREVPKPEPLAEADAGEVLQPVIVATGDPTEGIFGGVLAGGLVLAAFAHIIVASALQGFTPGFATALASGTMFWALLGGSIGVVGLAIVIGWLLGRAFAPRRR